MGSCEVASLGDFVLIFSFDRKIAFNRHFRSGGGGGFGINFLHIYNMK